MAWCDYYLFYEEISLEGIAAKIDMMKLIKESSK